MMFAWLSTWLFGALVMPSMNGLMSQRVPQDAQGELQGAVASLYGLSSILGPPIMTQLFGLFSNPAAPIHLPGAAFVCAAALAGTSFLLFVRAMARDRGPTS
jgi:DHA1 family tetracycline resistance protein-like MFS transporter